MLGGRPKAVMRRSPKLFCLLLTDQYNFVLTSSREQNADGVSTLSTELSTETLTSPVRDNAVDENPVAKAPRLPGPEVFSNPGMSLNGEFEAGSADGSFSG
jgi:hypothetical protein